MSQITDHIYDAIIVGAGYGGLGQGAQLTKDGVDNYLILEGADELGGVWRDNDYPGAACDTQALIYCYSYFLNLGVSRMYAGRDEMLGYLKAMADEFDLHDKIKLNSRVDRAEWLDEENVWKFTTTGGDAYYGRSFVGGWGQLSKPKIPNFPNMDAFGGIMFHSAQWDHSVDLSGKKVAAIGNAASAVQFVPEVAKVAADLTVFQRSANYILPRNQIVFSEEEQQKFKENPDSYREIRQEIHDTREAGFERTRKGTEAAEEGVEQAIEHLRSQVNDPELVKKLTPTYAFGCKRILRSDEFYPTFNRENVHLETSAIESFTEKGIRTTDGVEHEFDVVIFGTGFYSQEFQGDLAIIGRGGTDLRDRWGNSPEAYLGMAVDGYPNMFILYGPNTNLNHHSVVAMLEAQNKYIRQAVEHLQQHPDQPLDVKAEVLRHFNDEIQQELEQSAFSADCSSWYKNEDGKVINNWSGNVAEYHALTETLNLVDYGVK
ncbi:4-hydroxyacetophenone monooxygenase [Corynebacterium ciconiae DSM 44920]|uniref:flavin-containing monooxygenase n=1 Tax=Corynebacterium ciconiae TaxID=227319 RepID=UPI00036BE3C2|nr:NAD(P)/FAD-dependent oxidoreductase [Corynebacterium ciconiae]WKD60371.1 4-hydroxyacetophenone monooxygenase [Corynebacterium ciconiae DSM 44920]